jgi:hypothetical protein
MSNSEKRRRAFTVFEIVLAMTLLVVVMVLVARAGYWSRIERGRLATRQAALETANNILEAAQAARWDALTPAWAGAQRLPETWSGWQPDARLQVRVEPERSLPHSKRVTVTIQWEFREGLPPQELALTTLRSAREAMSEKGKGP